MISRRGSVCCLVIAEVLAEDEGQYAVTASNEHGSATTSARLAVTKQDEAGDEMRTSYDELYKMTTSTTSWGGELQQRQKVFEEFSQLEIDVSLSRKEAAQHAADVRSQTEAPSFTKKLESAEVFEGTPVRLECDVTGFPQPQITWYQDGKRLDGSSEGVRLDYTDDGHCSLTIDRVRVEHEAEYVCTATNQHGTASTWAEILVEKLIEGLEQLVMEEHYEVEIEMNFKWQKRHGQQLADEAPPASKQLATIN